MRERSASLAAHPRASLLQAWWVILLPFLGDFALGICFVAFPRTGVRFGANRVELGILGCAPQVTFVAACLLLGSFSDRWGRRRVLIAGMGIYALAFALAGAAGSLPALLIAAGVMGIAGGLFWPAFEGAVADAFGHGPLGRGLLLFNLGWTTGMMLGSWAGGRLLDLGASLPFHVQLGVSLLALVILGGVPSRGHEDDDESAPKAVPVPPATADRFLLLARVANFCCFFGIATIRALFAPLAGDLHFTGGLTGSLLAGVSLAQALSFLALSRWRRWQYRLMPLLAGQALVICAFLATAVVSSWWLFALCFAAVGAGCGVTYTASLFYSLNRPAERGKMGALHEAILGSGAMVGPLLGGVVAHQSGWRAPYLLAAGVMAIGMVLQARWRVRHKEP